MNTLPTRIFRDTLTIGELSLIIAYQDDHEYDADADAETVFADMPRPPVNWEGTRAWLDDMAEWIAQAGLSLDDVIARFKADGRRAPG